MLDLFAIFTKGGIVLWCFQSTGLALTRAVNSLIKTVILQERGGVDYYEHESLRLQFKLDNEFELIFVVAYQKILQLSYIDKLIQQTQLLYRDKYKNELPYYQQGIPLQLNSNHDDFTEHFQSLLNQLEQQAKEQALQPRTMRQFTKKGEEEKVIQPSNTNHDNIVNDVDDVDEGDNEEDSSTVQLKPHNVALKASARTLGGGVRKATKGRSKKSSSVSKSPKATNQNKPTKQARQWAGEGSVKEATQLNYSAADGNEESLVPSSSSITKGSMTGDLQPLSNVEESVSSSPKGGGGLLSFFKGLTGGKTITHDSMKPILDKMTDHLIGKNVASDIVDKLCQSVATKLDGKVIGTFSGVSATVKACFEESLIQILSPRRRVDVLREVMLSKQQKRKPYVITFCGVNGVGKSTNLAKVCFWLLDNGYRVLIAACDTFRSGAVEQLRTHTAHLSSLHPHGNGPPNVQLLERGYNKDAAGIAMEAIHYANQQGFDVVLVDTAGRMQNNEPLMIALAKLISVNKPDLVLFVGEALVGNEAVDQLKQFNRALRDYSEEDNATPIDGILLTKFDTIDDKVGAAISMTYTTGQPIIFIGTGQTYNDLKTLNVSSVVNSLLN